MSAERPCEVCGKDVQDDAGGIRWVTPQAEGDQRIEYFCAAHNPNPPTPEQLADRERQEFEAGVAALRAEERLIRGLADLEQPVTPIDRANIALELLRMLDRFIWQENKLRTLEGKPPIPNRMEWETWKPESE